MLAALVGLIIEDTELKAAFPDDGERLEDALARVKPLAAVLVDATMGHAASDVFVMRARRRGIPVIVFGERERIGRLRGGQRVNGMHTFILPNETAALRELLLRIPEAAPAPDRVERRAHTERAANGRLVFVDKGGRRWFIYDRRGGDRRQTVHRQFVSESGEVLGCDLAPGEERSESAEALQTQLSASTPELR